MGGHFKVFAMRSGIAAAQLSVALASLTTTTELI